MVTFSHVIRDPDGLHARPAGMLVKCAQGCGSAVEIEINGKAADAKRIFSVMRLCAKCNDTLEFHITGDDEVRDGNSLKDFCETNI